MSEQLPPDSDNFAPGFRVVYHVKHFDEAQTREQLDKYLEEHGLTDGGAGAADGVLVMSVKGKPGGPGPLQVYTLGIDGWGGKEYTPEQAYVLWTMMTSWVAKKLPDGSKKDFVMDVWEAIRQGVLRSRGEEKSDG